MELFKDVHKISVKSNVDIRGYFIEIFKLKNLNQKNKILQVSHSLIKKNVLKGWHFHKKQTQWNYLLKGKIKVFLIDYRKNSKTFKKMKSFYLDAKNEKIVYVFPSNIGHAYITYDKENHMIYGTSGYFDKNEEYKIKFDKSLIKKSNR